jgi:pyruvate kinase
MIRTKILATMGPACADSETILRMLEAGADACRLNFSHGSLDDHAKILRSIREAAERHRQHVAVLGDLCGPKIRLAQVRDFDGSGGAAIDIGDELVIQRAPGADGQNKRVSSTYPGIVDDVEIGHRLLIEDGLLRFVCTDKSDDELRCRCTAGGILKTGKGVNLPNSRVNLPSITDRDWEFVDWAIENTLDYLALSFVRRADELLTLREHLRSKVSDIHLVAKIEKSEAIDNIVSILDASDGLMIARGDLGVEMDVAQVPIIQKELIRRCTTAAKPVIVATQMLQSMIENSGPTRAEVSDVANAIFDGTDVVMLSGETAVGRFPVGTVHVMAHIVDTTERYIAGNESQAGWTPLRLKTMPLSAAVANGVRQIVFDLSIPLVVLFSQTGATARIFSKARMNVPVLALSSDPRALRRMSLHFGVIPLEMPAPDDMGQLVGRVDHLVQQRNFAKIGQRIVIVAGSSLGTPGTMNGITLHTVGENRLEPET